MAHQDVSQVTQIFYFLEISNGRSNHGGLFLRHHSSCEAHELVLELFISHWVLWRAFRGQKIFGVNVPMENKGLKD